MAKALAPVVAGLQESFRRVAPAVVAALENARKNADDVFGRAEDLGKLAWTLPMSATLPESRELVDAAVDADTLDAAFERFYFDDDGVHLEELWRDVMKSPTVEPWRPMIEQTRAAFDAELYLPSVAALLPVMDGLAHSAWGRRFYKSKYRERFFADKLSSIEPNTVSYFLWRSVSTFVAAIFADASGDAPPTIFNRHWILHGRGLPSGRRIDCVRVLQAIHTFQDLIRDP